MQSPEPCGVALIGCGWAGQRHADAFRAEGAELVWAVDSDLSRAGLVADLGSHTRASRDLEQALSDPAVSAADVCLPHHLHAEACLKSIAAGKDLLCEKPLAPGLRDADRIIEAAEEAGTVLMVAENECFDPRYRLIRKLIEADALGQPALIQASRECYLRESFMRDRPWFLNASEAGGGILLSGGIHEFAKLRMMLGEISTVYAQQARQRFLELEAEDTVVVMIRFENGTVGTLVASYFMLDPTTANGDEVHRLRIDGDSGSVEVAGPDRLRLSNSEGTQEIRVESEDTFQAEVREFLQCVTSRREPETSGRRQRRSLELVEATYASIASGSPVELRSVSRSP